MLHDADARPRLGVLTFHKCVNYGSYWQARCLVEGLRALGADAVILDHASPHIDRSEWRCALRPTLPQPSSRADIRAYAVKVRRFQRAFQDLPRSRAFAMDDPDRLLEYDRIVVGSDEVWNLRHPWYGGRPLFYGADLPGDKLVSYAASFGNYDAAEGLDGVWAGWLKRFRAISVRDDNSRRLVGAATGRLSELVLDPCLQFPQSVPRDGAAAEPYLALYGHGFSDDFAAQARRWADARRLRIVSIGYRNPWADEHRLSDGPEAFAAFISRSAAVVTNFFHGCVFALLNAKPLAAAPSAYRMNKIRDLFAALGAERHRVGEGSDALDAALEGPPEAHVFDRIGALRRSSEDYLRRSLPLAA